MFTIIMLFVTAQLALGVVIWFGLLVVRREPALGGRLAAITEVTHRPTRVGAARKEETRTRNEIEAVDKRLARARQRLADLIPMPESVASALGFGVLAFILYEGESAVALLLNLASRLGNMSDEIAGFFSPIVAAALFAALHVILGAMINIGARHRPERVVLRAKVGAAISGSAVILAAWAVLSGRSFSDPHVIENVASIGLTVLAVLLSVAGAFSSLVVTTLNDERALEQKASRLETLKTALERHLEAVQRDLQQHDAKPAVSQHRASVTGNAAAGVLLAIFLAQPAAAQSLARHPAAAPSATPASAERQSLVTQNSCEPLLDVSASLDAGARLQAVQRFANQLDTIAGIFNCEMFRLSAFSGEPPFNVLNEVSLAPLPGTSACSNIAPQGASPTKRAVQLLYPSVGAAHQDSTVRDCVAREQRQRDAASLERKASLDAATRVLQQLPRIHARGNCTALDIAVQRAIRRSQHVFVLSDGANTCEGSGIGSPTQLQNSQTLTFFLLPSAAVDASVLGLRHAARLESAYPTSRVLFFAELTPSLWKNLKPRN